MKTKLLLCSVLVVLAATAASAKNSPDKNILPTYNNILEAAKWSETSAPTSISLKGYKNILAAARWSTAAKLPPATGARNRAAGGRVQDLFGGGDVMFEQNSSLDGPRRDWKFCFSTCVESAMGGTGSLCVGNCVACGTGSVWGCAMCASCGAVGLATVEFCALKCCQMTGCPA